MNERVAIGGHAAPREGGMIGVVAETWRPPREGGMIGVVAETWRRQPELRRPELHTG